MWIPGCPFPERGARRLHVHRAAVRAADDDRHQQLQVPARDRQGGPGGRKDSAPLSSPGPARGWAGGRGRSTTSRCWSTPTSLPGSLQRRAGLPLPADAPRHGPHVRTAPVLLAGEVPLVNFWDVPHGKELDEDSFGHGRYDYQDWLTYLLLREGRGPRAATDAGQSPRHQEHQARQRPVLDRRRHPGFLPDARADRRVRRQRGVQRLLVRHQAQLWRPEHHPSRRCRGTSLEVHAQ